MTCYPEWAQTWRAPSPAIGVVNRDSLFCTGQLLDDQAHDLTPYWLTAHHCVSTAAQAKSAEIYWLYQTARCGGAPPRSAQRAALGGGDAAGHQPRRPTSRC